MKLDGRDLSPDLRGPDVARLHAELAVLGAQIAAPELDKQAFGATTRRAVLALQKRAGLPETGIVDQRTAAEINAAVDRAGASAWRVRGHVLTDQRAALPGVRVVVSDASLAGRRRIGTTSTDRSGGYLVEYDPARLDGKPAPDLVVEIFGADDGGDGPPLAAGEPAYNAGPDAVVDVLVPADKAQPGAEHDRLVGALTAQLSPGGPARLGELKEDGDRRDLTYLANKTGWDARLVAMAALADRFSADSGLPAPFYYALFRAGLPANPDVTAQLPAAAVEQLWTEAAKDGTIPAEAVAQIPKAVQRWTALGTDRALARDPLAGPSTLGQLLAASGLRDADRRTFARLFADRAPGADPNLFWDQVATAFGGQRADRLRVLGKLSYLTVNNAPLLDKLAATGVADPVELVGKGLYRPQAWLDLLGTDLPVPAQTPGADDKTRRANYAQLMADQVRLSYPTAVIADRIGQGELPLPASQQERRAVSAFLTAQQGGFELGVHPVDAYLERHGLAVDATTLTHLRTLQRVYQLSPTDTAMDGLLRHGFDSAYALVQYREPEFVAAFADDLGGADQARLTHTKARLVHNTVLNVAASYLAYRSAPTVRAVPAAGPGDPGIAVEPTLEELFGDQDYCACEHCRSVLSPAAYLVDLLQFIDLRRMNTRGVALPSTHARDNPVDVLLDRRPDLAHLQLSCENTNTVLPYIDLVNEICEYFVAHQLSLRGFTGHDVPDGISSADLLASPQFVDTAAYTALETARFPLGLPFSPVLAALRGYLDFAGVPLTQALERLRATDDLDAGGSGYGWRDILADRLGLSRAQVAILTDGGIPVQQLYGFDPASVSEAQLVADVGNAKRFARRLDLTYTEVVDLLRTGFANPDAVLLPKLEKLGVTFEAIQRLHDGTLSPDGFRALLPGDLDPAPYGGDVLAWLASNHDRVMGLLVLTDPAGTADLCRFETLEIRHALPDVTRNAVTAAELRALVRFVRLWRAVGWSMADTDRAVSTLWPAAQRPAPGDTAAVRVAKLDAGFAAVIVGLGHLTGALAALGVTAANELVPLLACFGPIDTARPDSLYRRLFRNPTVLAVDDVFAEDGSGAFPKPSGAKLLAHAPALQAAVNLTRDELDPVLAKLNYDETTPLSLETLSAVFRHAYLARRLRLSITELLTLAELSGLDPFAPLTGAGSAFVGFVELTQLLLAGGVPVTRLAYLVADRDPTGRAGPSRADVLAQIRELRATLTRIERENAVADDPTGETTQARMALVYGPDVADTFFGLLAGGPTVSVPFDNGGPLPAAVLAAAPGLGYDDFAKQLRYAGVMTEATRTALTGLAGVSATFVTAVGELFAAGRAAVAAFFDRYPGLRPYYTAFADSTDPLPQRYTALLAAFLPELRELLTRQAVRQAVAAQTGLAPADARALLEAPALLHAVADPAAPAIADFLAVAQGGLTASYFLADDPTGPPDQVVPAVPAVEFRPGGAGLPTRPGDPTAPISAVFTGYLESADTGPVNLLVEADPAATVTLSVDEVEVPVARQGNGWHNQQPIPFAAGVPRAVRLVVRTVRTSLVLRWESRSTARDVVPAAAAYPQLSVDRYAASALRLAKALAIADTAGLGQPELRFFAASRTVDGQGWLNAIPAGAAPASGTARALFAVVADLLRYARLRADLGAGGAALVAAMADPAGPDLPEVTGFGAAALDAVLSHLGLVRADLARVPVLLRVRDALGVVSALGVAAPAVLAAVRPDPDLAAVIVLQSAVRARYDETAWREVVQPINDELRSKRRDALVAHILHGLAGNPATAGIDTADKLFEYLLIDVSMDPCMQTSRIKQAISTVQLFIARCLLNLEDRVAASAIDAGQWAWMKRYRVWEANRKVFLWPENWLEPELRDDKSPFFRDLEAELLAGDVTDDRAAVALGHYLEQLAGVARLEVAGMALEERDGSTHADDVVHVVARTAGAHRQYHYRRQSGASWSPWTRVNVDIEDNPVLPVVWKGRLFLFWLSVVTRGQPTPTPAGDSELNSVKLTQVKTDPTTDVAVNLHWSEYLNGSWQAASTSDVSRPLSLGSFPVGGFDRAQLALFAEQTPDGSLRIYLSGQGSTSYFTLHNTHSLPTRPQDEQLGLYPPWVLMPVFLLRRARGFGTFGGLSVDYFDPYSLIGEALFSQQVLRAAHPYQVVSPGHPLADPFGAPFFVQDRRYAFFVTPRPSVVFVSEWDGFGVPHDPPQLVPDKPPIVVKPDFGLALPHDPDPFPRDIVVRPGVVDPSPLRTFLDQTRNVATVLGSGGTVLFDGMSIGPGGAVARAGRQGNF